MSISETETAPRIRTAQVRAPHGRTAPRPTASALLISALIALAALFSPSSAQAAPVAGDPWDQSAPADTAPADTAPVAASAIASDPWDIY